MEANLDEVERITRKRIRKNCDLLTPSLISICETDIDGEKVIIRISANTFVPKADKISVRQNPLIFRAISVRKRQPISALCSAPSTPTASKPAPRTPLK